MTFFPIVINCPKLNLRIKNWHSERQYPLYQIVSIFEILGDVIGETLKKRVTLFVFLPPRRT